MKSNSTSLIKYFLFFKQCRQQLKLEKIVTSCHILKKEKKEK